MNICSDSSALVYRTIDSPIVLSASRHSICSLETVDVGEDGFHSFFFFVQPIEDITLSGHLLEWYLERICNCGMLIGSMGSAMSFSDQVRSLMIRFISNEMNVDEFRALCVPLYVASADAEPKTRDLLRAIEWEYAELIAGEITPRDFRMAVGLLTFKEELSKLTPPVAAFEAVTSSNAEFSFAKIDKLSSSTRTESPVFSQLVPA